jgi:hypothetical protein
MTIEQTVEIPANRRLTLDLPDETPAGTVKIELSIYPIAGASRSGLASYLASNSPRTIEEALAEAERKAADPNRKPFSGCFGILKDSAAFAGDPVEIQKAMRAEWDNQDLHGTA